MCDALDYGTTRDSEGRTKTYFVYKFLNNFFLVTMKGDELDAVKNNGLSPLKHSLNDSLLRSREAASTLTIFF